MCVAFLPSKADEGMWLLQLMQEQHLADRMKAQGLKLDADDIYHPNKVSLKDAVGIFGGGCTGEIISPDGLILTNHHCGYASIQQHSSVEHDYLTDGFWAKSRKEELPTPGLKFKFVERIVDVTDKINAKVKAGEVKEEETFGQPFLHKFANEELKASPDITVGLKQLYAVEPGMTEHDDSPDADEQAVRKLEIYTDPPQSEDEPATRPWKAGRYKRKYTW